MITYKRPTPYRIEGRPVKVFKEPTFNSTVINAIPPGSSVIAIGEENSYIQLYENGGFIFKSPSVVLDRHTITKTIMEEKLQKRIKKKVEQTRVLAANEQLVGKPVTISKDIKKDNYGNDIADTDRGILYYDKTADDGGIIVVNKANNHKYKLDASNINVLEADIEENSVQSDEPSTTVLASTGEVSQTAADVYVAQKKEEEEAASNTTNDNSAADTNALIQAATKAKVKLDEYLKTLKSNNNDFDNSIFQVRNTRSVFGFPYQFEPTVDNRLDGSFDHKTFGRKFSQKIVSRAPILILQAGVPDFLKGFSDQDQQTVIGELKKTLTGDQSTNADKIANQAGKYYAFKEASVDYFKAVNDMCRATASMIGVGHKSVDINGESGELYNFNWSKAASGNGGSHNLFGYYRQAVAFYANAEPQIQDGFANGARQSQLAGRVNQISDQAAELQFILGTVSTVDPTGITGAIKENLPSQENAAKDNAEGAKDTGVIGTLIDKMDTLMSGGKLIFPEIWSDSNYTKSYNITIKLDSPDCDPLSIYLNIIAPLCHILGFCMPRWSGANAYVSPFIVRAYMRSMFHVDMGIITSCDIVRGTQQGWTQDGLPTEVTVNLTIKDLYNVLSMIVSKNLDDIIANPAQLDYLGNLCGINVAVPDFQRTLALWVAARNPATILSDAVLRVQSRMAGAINNRWQNLFNNYWRM